MSTHQAQLLRHGRPLFDARPASSVWPVPRYLYGYVFPEELSTRWKSSLPDTVLRPLPNTKSWRRPNTFPALKINRLRRTLRDRYMYMFPVKTYALLMSGLPETIPEQ